MERAVVLAGGLGTRLKPLPVAFPKPLMPIGDTPILDIIVQQLRLAGVTRITMAVGHLAELIVAYFNDARFDDLAIDYSREPHPLGTAGPLTLIPNVQSRFLVLNGDVLASIDYRDLIRSHREAGAVATIASYKKELKIDLGVLEVDEGGTLRAYVEKPVHTYRVSMGIYVFEPEVLKFLAPGKRCDLPDLISRILDAGRPLHVYSFDGSWFDIGRPDDYAHAVEQSGTLLPSLISPDGR